MHANGDGERRAGGMRIASGGDPDNSNNVGVSSQAMEED